MLENQPRFEMVANKSCFKCSHVNIKASLIAQRQHDCSKVIEDRKIKVENANEKKAFRKKK
jgi:hypothetical protein